MIKTFLPAVIALVVGFGAGYAVTGQQNGDTPNNMQENHAMEMNGEGMAMDSHGSHSHDSMEVSSHEGLPEVNLTIHQDPKSGWNAQITLQNFSFAPERVSTSHVLGEGHAHIYVDGVKINRVYSEWYHLGELESGVHEISATLSSNDHKELTHDGTPISDTEIIEVQ